MLRLRGTLPTPLTGFVGRKRELQRLSRLLGDPEARLLTLVGPGGVGKTRLAIEAARQAAERFPDGLFFVELTRLSDPAQFGDLLCEAIGLPPSASPETLAAARDALRDRCALLLLDNCEHLREAAPDIVRLLLDCPGLRALVTSRLPLRTLGETVMRISPLPVPVASEQTDSVELFVKRAQSAHLGWKPSPERMEEIAALCRRLDGLPLALEIAAARIRQQSVRQMLADLEAGRYFLQESLTGGVGRTQSLESAIAWSYATLSPTEQRVFRSLAVFRGSFDREDAAAVCAGIVIEPVLETLCEHSLLTLEERTGEPRYRMLEILRVYACQRAQSAGEWEEIAQRHASRFLTVARAVEAQMRAGAQTEALARLAESLDNLRAAMLWAQQRGESTLTAAFGAATARFWQIRGPFREGAEHLRHAVEAARNLRESRMLAQLLSDYGSLLCLHGEHARARPLFEEALTLWREQNDQAGVARVLNNLGNVADVLGEPEEAAVCHMKSLALRRALGDEPGIGATINNLALLARKRGDYTEAARLLEEAWSVYQRLNDLHRAAIALNNLADVATDQGDLERAEQLYQRCGALYEQIGDRCGLATVTAGLADIAAQRGDREQARRLYARSMEDYEAVGDQRALASARARLQEMEEDRPEAAAPPTVPAPAYGVAVVQTAAPRPASLLPSQPTRDPASPPRLYVRLLGGFSLEPADPSVRLPGWSRRSHRMLLQYLCLHADVPAPRTLLSELLWSHLEPAAAQHALRKALSETRAVLAPLEETEPLLSVSRDSICLHTQAGIQVDVIAFRRLVAQTTVQEATGFTDAVQQSLLQADALYRGELLPEERTAEWVEEERRRLADLHTAVLLALARYAHRAENWSEVERYTERLLAADPCLESACRLRMVALSRQGRRAEALRAFETCREALREELALAPSARTLAVVKQIRALGAGVNQ